MAGNPAKYEVAFSDSDSDDEGIREKVLKAVKGMDLCDIPVSLGRQISMLVVLKCS